MKTSSRSASSYWQLESLQSRIRSLEAEILRVSNKDHPYPEPDAVYKTLLGVVRARAKRLEEVWQLDSPDIRGDRRLKGISSNLAKDLQRVAEVFSLVGRVDSARIPFELLRPLSWVAGELLVQ